MVPFCLYPGYFQVIMIRTVQAINQKGGSDIEKQVKHPLSLIPAQDAIASQIHELFILLRCLFYLLHVAKRDEYPVLGMEYAVAY
ncbi:hypothetical protein TNCV_2925141 [Trichonephila clavipes]|nr:hypothetical protein TNCV_2925141 [Trichonephila clavipes]